MRKLRLIHLKKKKWYVPVVSLLSGLIVIAMLLALFSALMTKLDVSDSVVSFMGIIALCAGGFSTGFFTGKNKRHGGIKHGIICGITIYAVVMIFGTIMMRTFLGFRMIKKLVIICICGIIGGICGVNTKIRKPPA